MWQKILTTLFQSFKPHHWPSSAVYHQINGPVWFWFFWQKCIFNGRKTAKDAAIEGATYSPNNVAASYRGDHLQWEKENDSVTVNQRGVEVLRPLKALIHDESEKDLLLDCSLSQLKHTQLILFLATSHCKVMTPYNLTAEKDLSVLTERESRTELFLLVGPICPFTDQEAAAFGYFQKNTVGL